VNNFGKNKKWSDRPSKHSFINKVSLSYVFRPHGFITRKYIRYVVEQKSHCLQIMSQFISFTFSRDFKLF
jgi:hypothetical protein